MTKDKAWEAVKGQRDAGSNSIKELVDKVPPMIFKAIEAEKDKARPIIVLIKAPQ